MGGGRCYVPCSWSVLWGSISHCSFGPQWLDLTPIAMLLLLCIPFFIIISFIGDVIAGERERHTLETLLASRMPDRAILLGKVITTVCMAGAWAAQSVARSGFSGPVSHQGNWMFYPLDLFLEALALSLLVSVLAASAGVLISLRVSTVRQAQQISERQYDSACIRERPCTEEPCLRISSHRSPIRSFCSLSWRLLPCWMRSCLD